MLRYSVIYLEGFIELLLIEHRRSVAAYVRPQAVLGTVVDLLHQTKHLHRHLAQGNGKLEIFRLF